jgi:hypothetical protein
MPIRNNSSNGKDELCRFCDDGTLIYPSQFRNPILKLCVLNKR